MTNKLTTECLQLTVLDLGRPGKEIFVLNAEEEALLSSIESELFARFEKEVEKRQIKLGKAVVSEIADKMDTEETVVLTETVVVLPQADRSEFNDQELLWLSGLHKEARDLAPDMEPARPRFWRKGFVLKVAKLFGMSC